MMKRKPGLDKAVLFLVESIRSKNIRDRLPSIRLLANKAEVSFVTMWKAIQDLKSKGIIRDNNEIAGYDKLPEYRECTSPAQQELLDSNALWEKIKALIKKDILCGRYSPGIPLPSCKEMQSIYRISFPTIKRALKALASEDIIKVHKKGYIVPLLTMNTRTARVVALGCGWEDAKIWTDYQDKEYFRLLESACIQSKVALDVVVYFRQNGQLCFIHSATRQPYNLKNDSILGIAYIVANLELKPEEVLAELTLLKKPIAILDVVGGWNIPAFSFANRYLQFFTATTSLQPARQAAKYLLSHGHTTIAYISPFHKALWSKRRLQGVNQIYIDAGHPGGVVPFCQNKYAYQWDYLQHLEKQEDILAFIDEYNRWKEYAHSKLFRKFGNISYSISKYLTQQNCASGEIFQKMTPLFANALKNKDITAWLMANDYSATLAIDYLKEQKIKVPEEMSVIAFDNSIEAMEYQLTSFDFNNNAIMNLMLRYILSPSSLPLSERNKVMEVDGMLVERLSVARLARK